MRLAGKAYKWMLAALVVVLLLLSSQAQRGLNHQRTALGLREFTELKGAPPALAFTTVALGGVRGLVANLLWVRSIELQDQGKYFEKVQLVDWITKLQPHMAQVWTMQAWDMAYNISVKFTAPADRWRWVQRGFELLRDEGLKYNPTEPMIYHGLAWIFQHKIGHNLDDAHAYYKYMWEEEMRRVLGPRRPNYDELLNPQTDEARERVARLREQFKLDPQVMKTVDEGYGPLEWRLPDAHAIYWAYLGLQRNPKQQEAMMLKRVIYQSMMQAFLRGRLISVRSNGSLVLDPNLDVVPKLNEIFLDLMNEGGETRAQLQSPYRNWIKNVVEFLYVHNRIAEAGRWYQVLGEKFPNDAVLPEENPSLLPRDVSLDEFVLRRVSGIAGETDRNKTTAVLSGLFVMSFVNLAFDEDDQAVTYDRLARRIWERYMGSIGQTTDQKVRVGLDDIAEIRQRALDVLLTDERRLEPELRARLLTKLKLPASTNTPPAQVRPAPTPPPAAPSAPPPR